MTTQTPLPTLPETASRDERILHLTRTYFEQLQLLLPEIMGGVVLVQAPSPLQPAGLQPITWVRPGLGLAEQGFMELGLAKLALQAAGAKTESSFAFVRSLGEMAYAEASKPVAGGAPPAQPAAPSPPAPAGSA